MNALPSLRSLRVLALCLLLLLALAPVVLAQDGDGDDSADDSVTLAMKWNAGEVARTRVTIRQASEITGMQNMEMVQTIEMQMRQHVAQVSDEGVATIRVTYESIRQTVDANGMAITYDSTIKEPQPAAEQSGLSAMGAMCNKTWTVEVDKTGKVVKLHDDVAAFREAVLDEVMQNPNGAAMRDAMADALSDDTIRADFERFSSMLPTGPVKFGKSFDLAPTTEFPLGTVTLSGKAVVTRVTDDDEAPAGSVRMRHTGTASIEFGGSNPALAQLDLKLVSGTFKNETIFDVARGQVFGARNVNTLKLEMRQKGAGANGPPMVVQTVQSGVTVETLSVTNADESTPGGSERTPEDGDDGDDSDD